MLALPALSGTSSESNAMTEVVIVDAARTPVGRKMGKLAGAHPDCED